MTKSKQALARQGVIVVLLSALFYGYEFLARTAPGVLAVPLMHAYHVGPMLLGVISACFFYGYVPMQVPAGLIVDRLGPRWVLIGSAFLCTSALALFASSHSAFPAGFARFLMGLTSAFAYIVPLTLVRVWIHKSRQTLMTGVVQTIGCLGGLFAGVPIALLTDHFGWRASLNWVVLFGLVMVLLFFLFVKAPPKKAGVEGCGDDGSHAVSGEWARLKLVLSSPQSWLIGLVVMACWSPMAVFAEMWGVNYLRTLKSLGEIEAASLLQWVWIGVIIGGPLLGAISDKMRRRCWPIAVALLGGLLAECLFVVASPDVSLILLRAALFMFGVSGASQAVTFGLVTDNNPKGVTATAFGFNNMACILGAGLFQPLAGWFIERLGGYYDAHHGLMYPLVGYQHAFLLMPVITLIGLLVLWFCVRETHAKATYMKGGTS